MSRKSNIYSLLRVSNDISALCKGKAMMRLWNKLIGRMAARLYRHK